MITYEDFCFRVPCDKGEFEIAQANAKKKLTYIISRYGDENGERLADWYLEQLISEELRAERVSKIFKSVFEDRAEERMRGISA